MPYISRYIYCVVTLYLGWTVDFNQKQQFLSSRPSRDPVNIHWIWLQFRKIAHKLLLPVPTQRKMNGWRRCRKTNCVLLTYTTEKIPVLILCLALLDVCWVNMFSCLQPCLTIDYNQSTFYVNMLWDAYKSMHAQLQTRFIHRKKDTFRWFYSRHMVLLTFLSCEYI